MKGTLKVLDFFVKGQSSWLIMQKIDLEMHPHWDRPTTN